MCSRRERDSILQVVRARSDHEFEDGGALFPLRRQEQPPATSLRASGFLQQCEQRLLGGGGETLGERRIPTITGSERAEKTS